MRVVFDTNVFISAFITPGGRGEAACLLAIGGLVELAVSVPILTELARKLEQLQLTTISQELDHVLADAASRNLSHQDTIGWLADIELEGRKKRSIERRFRLSKLQAKLGIESFDFRGQQAVYRVADTCLFAHSFSLRSPPLALAFLSSP